VLHRMQDGGGSLGLIIRRGISSKW